jgi:anti-sigma regulatory factor (Ser/Thr protein kinase)
VVDAISEGLANAVRHGDGTPVSLEVRPDRPSGVEVVVVSGGTLVSAQPGIGLRQLSEHGAVSLHESGAGRVELAVAIP